MLRAPGVTNHTGRISIKGAAADHREQAFMEHVQAMRWHARRHRPGDDLPADPHGRSWALEAFWGRRQAADEAVGGASRSAPAIGGSDGLDRDGRGAARSARRTSRC